jgi:phage FluMu protein Com
MGSRCTDGFHKKQKKGTGHLESILIWSSNVFCDKCKIVAKRILIEHKSSSSVDERGTLITSWDEITIKCRRCKKTGVYNDNYREEDGTYYSNSYRRAYRMRD